MSSEELEFSISQYLDGTLPPLEKSALEEKLATSAEARALLEEYQRLNSVLKTSAPVVPDISWDRLAGQIHASLENEGTPIRHFKIPKISWTGRLAIAASLLFILSVAIHFISPPQTTPENQGTVIVTGPRAQQAEGPVVAEISIGPATNLAQRPYTDNDVVSRPNVVIIDRAPSTAQDNDPNMY